MVWEGRKVIGTVRRMMGSTDSAEAPSGTIRGDLALSSRYNLMHASDSTETAAREISLFFPDEALLSYERLEDSFPFVDTDFPPQ
jgi:nucleoside-diphosphate kinase